MSFVTRYLEPALVERLNYLQVTARSVVEGATTGLHRSPLKGASVEFRQHRFYTPGDEPRRFGGRVQQWLVPRSGTQQLSRVIDLLERAGPRGESDPGKAMQDVADRLGRRSLVIAVSDVFTPVARLREGLARLRHDRHETIMLQVLDNDETEFPFRRWARFRGLE